MCLPLPDQSLGQEDPLMEEMATHSSILSWKNPMDRGAWPVRVNEVAKELDITSKLNNDKITATVT